ncbi:MAG: hypothetical protein JWO38_5557 [Gemmataceae bacterium]|nr:hypothetical protein [Gemmataceae bacterium]
MKRYLCCLAVLGVVAVPDWASAFHPCWAPPPPCSPGGYGIYGSPPPVYPQQLMFVPPYVPVYEVPLPAPRVYPSAPAATAPRPATPTPNPGTTKATPTPTPTEPAAPLTTRPPTPPATPDPGVRPAGADTPPPITPPKPDIPPPANPPPTKPPALVLPTIPGVTDTKPTGPTTPSAVPSPAPPAPDFGPAMPAKLPLPPEPKKPDGPGDTLPPLTLPPESPAAPSGVVPPAGPSTSRSSPLTGGVKVQVFTAAGAPPSAATRKVGFFNHTDKDIDLVIEGRTVTLPRKSYIQAEVSPVFNWKRSDHPAETATVPDGAAGLDVLFRE